jgi:hypothetical protein
MAVVDGTAEGDIAAAMVRPIAMAAGAMVAAEAMATAEDGGGETYTSAPCPHERGMPRDRAPEG